MRFHPSLDRNDFFLLHPSLIEIFGNIVDHCLGEYNVIPTVTSMIRPRTTDSGVHETGRSLDFSRHMHDFKTVSISGAYRIVRSVPEEHCFGICKMINAVYPRSDELDTLKWHNSGQGWHFHLQVPSDPAFNGLELENIALANSRRKRV